MIDIAAHALIGSTCASMMKHSFTIDSVIPGYHDGWNAPIDEVLYCEREIGNRSDPCAMAVKRATLGDAASLILNFILGGAGSPQIYQW